MSKRKTESSSSSSSSDEDSNKIGGDGGAKPPLSNENGSRKKTKNCSAEQRGTSPVASTSAQLQRKLGIIVKGEDSEESEVEHTQLTDSPPRSKGGSRPASPAAQQSNPEVASSKQVLSKVQKVMSKDPKKPPPSKKVPVLKPHEKYFNGCLVMAWFNEDGYPWWPAMIRKGGANKYTKTDRRGRIWLFVQFFTNPTSVTWRLLEQLKVFDAAKPNRCSDHDPNVIARFEKGIRIANAAANFAVEARLTKFSLPRSAKIDDLLGEIDAWNGEHASRDDSLSQNEDEDAAPTELNSMLVIRNDSVSQVENDTAQGNRRSITDVFAGLNKQAEFLMNKDLKREKAIKALTTDNSKLTEENTKLKTTIRDLKLRLQSKEAENGMIVSLERKLKAKEETIVELRENLQRTEKDKLGYMEELEKMRSEAETLEGKLHRATGT